MRTWVGMLVAVVLAGVFTGPDLLRDAAARGGPVVQPRRQPIALAVRAMTKKVAGDVAIPARWGKAMYMETRGLARFRFKRLAAAPRKLGYEVHGGPRRGFVRKGAVRPPVAFGALNLSGRAQTSEFSIDFTQFLPAQPNNMSYTVYLVDPTQKALRRKAWSNAVQVHYKPSPDAGTTFASPTLTRVVGTWAAAGGEIRHGGLPVAAIGYRFKLEGRDLDEVPALTRIQFLRLGTLVREVVPNQRFTKKNPAGGRTNVFLAYPPKDLARGRYDVRVKGSFGPTSSFPMWVSAGIPANVKTWGLVHGGTYENHNWTEECQGITTDGKYWYITSNYDGKRALYRFSRDMQPRGKHNLEQYGCKHIGDVDYHNGNLYIACEQPKKLLVLDARLTAKGRLYNVRGKPDPLGGSFAWCAVHPISGDVYSSNFDSAGGVDRVVYYRKKDGEYWYAGARIFNEPRHRIQGGDISPNGTCLLAVDSEPFSVIAFDTETGKYYGRVTYAAEGNEVEGLTISPANTVQVKGHAVNIHFILLDNDPTSLDDVAFRHIRVPNTKELFGW